MLNEEYTGELDFSLWEKVRKEFNFKVGGVVDRWIINSIPTNRQTNSEIWCKKKRRRIIHFGWLAGQGRAAEVLLFIYLICLNGYKLVSNSICAFEYIHLDIIEVNSCLKNGCREFFFFYYFHFNSISSRSMDCNELSRWPLTRGCWVHIVFVLLISSSQSAPILLFCVPDLFKEKVGDRPPGIGRKGVEKGAWRCRLQFVDF